MDQMRLLQFKRETSMKNLQTRKALLCLALFLTPLVAFAGPRPEKDCDHRWKDSDCVVPMTEHWGLLETSVVTLGTLWLLAGPLANKAKGIRG